MAMSGMSYGETIEYALLHIKGKKTITKEVLVVNSFDFNAKRESLNKLWATRYDPYKSLQVMKYLRD
ncbi:hypothetical protein BOW52_10525, partial [Solemya elarraichensis gill symbiont]